MVNGNVKRRRGRTDIETLERLVHEYTEASARFTSAQSAAGSWDTLILAYHERKAAIRSLKRHGYTVDTAYARLQQHARDQREDAS